MFMQCPNGFLVVNIYQPHFMWKGSSRTKHKLALVHVVWISHMKAKASGW